MSPDSRRVAFVVNSWDRENDRFNSDIWLVDEIRQGQTIRLTSHPKRDDSLRWSPDARRIAFLSERGADADAGGFPSLIGVPSCSGLRLLPRHDRSSSE